MTYRVAAPALSVEPNKLGFFRYGKLGDGYVLTNDVGEWTLMSSARFRSFLQGEITTEDPDYASLVEKGFIRAGFDIESFAQRLRRKKSFLGQGPHLHIVITTLRCNQSCK